MTERGHSSLWLVVAGAGFGLAWWAKTSLPEGTSMVPQPIEERTAEGPYAWFDHPMYVGNVLFLGGLAGYAGGAFNAVAVGGAVELFQRHWVMIEEGEE